MKFIIAAGVLVLLVAGFVLAKGPSPAISVAPEHIFNIGSLGVTNTMFTSWIVVLFMCVVGIIAGRSMTVVPHGFSGAVEAVVGGFLGIVEGIAGEQNGRRFFWVIATIFFYVLTSNYFGLLPINNVIGKVAVGEGTKQVIFKDTTVAGVRLAYIPSNPQQCVVPACPSVAEGEAPAASATAESGTSGQLAPWFRSVNTDVNTPAAIAIFSFIFVEFWGLSTLGLGYLKKFFNFGAILHGKPMGLIDIFVGLLELISELSRMVSFTFRLFGNIFAGEVVLTMMVFLVPFVLVDLFYGLELLVGLVQAFVFAMLSLVFAQMAVAHHGGEEHTEAHSEAH